MLFYFLHYKTINSARAKQPLPDLIGMARRESHGKGSLEGYSPCGYRVWPDSVHTHFWRRGRVISGPGEGREQGAYASLAWLVGRGQARLQDAESSSSVHWLSCECPSPQRGLSSHSPQYPEQWPVGSRCSISL